MKRFVSFLLSIVLLVSAAQVVLGAPQEGIIIEQIYGGGGKGETPISNSFIELYNPTGSEIDLSAYALKYGDKTLEANHKGNRSKCSIPLVLRIGFNRKSPSFLNFRKKLCTQI